VQRIASRHHAVVARYRDVAKGHQPELVLLDGAHLVGDALRSSVRVLHLVVAADKIDANEIAPLVVRARDRGVDIAVGTAPVMDALSPVRSPSPIVGLAERPAREEQIYGGAHALVLIACDVQDPGNVGAMVRVAEAAGASGLVAAGQSADPLGWKAVRGSMGSALRLPVARRAHVADAVAEAKQHRCRVVAAVPRAGRPLFGAALEGPTAVLIGGEGGGLAPQIESLADDRLTVPMQAPVESLNAAVTAALILYEACRQRI
jgi:TrmH family RNA methyltransferase